MDDVRKSATTEAAERVVESLAGAGPTMTYPRHHDPIEALHAEAITVARAWLSQHPADDGEAVTPEWLRSIGFTDYNEPSQHSECFLSLWIDRREHNVAFLAVHWARPTNKDGHYWSCQGFSLYKPAYPKTRGDVRRLLLALGYPNVQ